MATRDIGKGQDWGGVRKNELVLNRKWQKSHSRDPLCPSAKGSAGRLQEGIWVHPSLSVRNSQRYMAAKRLDSCQYSVFLRDWRGGGSSIEEDNINRKWQMFQSGRGLWHGVEGGESGGAGRNAFQWKQRLDKSLSHRGGSWTESRIRRNAQTWERQRKSS